MPDGRVLVAFDDGPLEPSPTWTRLDDTDNLIAGFDISRGRQTLADQTDTGTASVYVNDTDGLFDPNNTGSPYFGVLDGKQIMLQIRNPVSGLWVTQYRGTIDGYGYDINPATDQNGDLRDAVVMDDFIYGEPVPEQHDRRHRPCRFASMRRSSCNRSSSTTE